MSMKLYSDVWNDEYIILYFGGRIMSGCKIIEGTPEASPGPRKRTKMDRITGDISPVSQARVYK